MPVFDCRALSREPVNCDPWAGWDPLPSPDSSRRHIANGAQTEIPEEPTNGLHNSGMHFSANLLERIDLLISARAIWDPLLSPDSSTRQIASGAQTEVLEEPMNRLHNAVMLSTAGPSLDGAASNIQANEQCIFRWLSRFAPPCKVPRVWYSCTSEAF